MQDRDQERFMLPLLLPLLFLVGIVCCVRPAFFAKRPGLRLSLLFRMIPEQRHTTVIRSLGVVAILGSVVGLIQLIKTW